MSVSGQVTINFPAVDSKTDGIKTKNFRGYKSLPVLIASSVWPASNIFGLVTRSLGINSHLRILVIGRLSNTPKQKGHLMTCYELKAIQGGENQHSLGRFGFGQANM